MFSKISSKLPSQRPWGSHGVEEQAAENADTEQSLTTILETREARTNLLLLVADCTEIMRKNISDTFDPEETGPPPKLPEKPAPPEAYAGDGSGQSTEEESNQLTPEEKAKKEKEEQEKKQKEHGQRVKEISAPKMLELKQSALDYFDDWRDRVLERVGEAVNKHTEDEAENQSQKPSEDTSSSTITDQLQKDERANTALHELFPPRNTPLTELSEAKRALILHSLLLLVLSLEKYPGESRVLLLRIASSLNLPLEFLTEDETKVAQGLLEAARKMNAEEETQKKKQEGSNSRKWKVGLGAVAGAALIGITGGLAAPLLAAGIGTVMGGLGLGGTAAAAYLGALAGSAPLVGALFGAYGGRMTGKIVDQYAKEVEDFAFIPVRKQHMLKEDKEHRRLRVAIAISGWLTQAEEVVKPWRVIGTGIEAFALRFELEAMMNLGNSLTTYVKSAAWSIAKREIITRTIFGALAAGLWPIGLVKVARVIDNPFSVARSRSEKAGRVLADALINKVQGERPVTLIGYSLGARVIYSCLTTLAERKAFGLVESVVLAGAPTPSNSLEWRKMRSVVSGRVVNVYSTSDYLLGFLYRTSSLQYGIAGLQAVEGVAGIENVDVSDIVDGHTKYRYLTGSILKKIGIEDIDAFEVEQEEKNLKQEEQKEKEEQERKEAEAKEKGEDADGEAQEMEHEVEKKNQQGMMGWVSNKMSAIKLPGKGKEQGEHGEHEQAHHNDKQVSTYPGT